MSEQSLPKVEILMATYNGEKYIRKQLDSILNQSYQNWNLLVRDDGSNDNTVSILNEYAKRDSRIKIMINTSNIHGWQQNFQELMFSADLKCEYFMFCDQDDIWLNDKIRDYVIKMNKLSLSNPGRPIVVYSDMDIIDEKDNITEPSMNKVYPINVKRITDCFFSQRIYGCNEMLNRKVITLCCEVLDYNYHKDMAHDGFVVKATAADDGVLCFIPRIYMHYRRTNTNATGNQELNMSVNKVVNKIMHFRSAIKDQVPTYKQSLWFFTIVKDHESLFSASMKMLEIEKAIRSGGFELLKVWVKYHVTCGTRMQSLSHFFFFFLGSHKKYLKLPQHQAVRQNRLT